MKLLTIPNAAKACTLPYQTLLRLVNEGHVRSVEIPGRRSKLVDLADVESFIESLKSGSIPGSVPQEIPAQVAPNKASRKAQKTGLAYDKYKWCNDFTGRRTKVS